MNRLRILSAVGCVVAAVTIVGCKSKQEAPKAAAPAAGTAAPQQGEAVKSISGQIAAGAVTASPQDKADAEKAATQVIALMEAGDFAKVYQQAGPVFKQIGPENAFAAKFSQTRNLTGPLANPKQTSFVVLPDKSFVLVYRMENPRYTTDRRFTFARSKEGKMELIGLNQHDEPKKVAAKK
ncbi:hypothetical protein [Geomesophilobacter sediminis]|uniref:Lipoprotein n=1 Tax=Geomesophilobacter sediminis TaxID=2798584 RepID=A0A8J7M225_9BACT|nr:hypothetical protein [Geomesophilobacter sediminis]MBJ6727279.1 hypothetical protein [Geomesophilobacter sediminis]